MQWRRFLADEMEAVGAGTAFAVPCISCRRCGLLDVRSLRPWLRRQPAQIERSISQAPNKACQLDPIPGWIVKRFAVQLSSFITTLFNVSFSTGCFLQIYKYVIVSPLLKKGEPRFWPAQELQTSLDPVCHCCRSCRRQLPGNVCRIPSIGKWFTATPIGTQTMAQCKNYSDETVQRLASGCRTWRNVRVVSTRLNCRLRNSCIRDSSVTIRK
jgi:hypothetical protein